LVPLWVSGSQQTSQFGFLSARFSCCDCSGHADMAANENAPAALAESAQGIRTKT
jgi:hypothetical protein